MEFLRGRASADAARLLYQVEVLLLRPHVAMMESINGKQPAGSSMARDAAAAEEQQALSCRVQLLAVLGEVILDESMPAAGVPFFTRLFQEGAQQLLPQHPNVKARLQYHVDLVSCAVMLYAMQSSSVIKVPEGPLPFRPICGGARESHKWEYAGGSGEALDDGVLNPRQECIAGGRGGSTADVQPGLT